MVETAPQNAIETAPQSPKIEKKKKEKRKWRIKVYVNEQELQNMADAAWEAGFRRGGLPIFKKKEHGFDGEVEINSDGISTYLKYCHKQRKALELIKEGLKGLG
jgi:hypothetical protein